MTIPQRLMAIMGISLLVTIIIGLSGAYGIYFNARVTQNLVENGVNFRASVQQLKIEALQHRRYEKDFFLNIGKPEKQKKYVKKFQTVATKTRKHLTQLESMDKTQLNSAHAAPIKQATTAYGNYQTHFMNLIQTIMAQPDITPQKANKMMTPFKNEIYLFENSIDTIEKGAKEQLTEMIANAGATTRKLEIIIVSGIGVGILIICLLNAVVIRTLSNTLKRIIDGLNSIASQLVSASGQVSDSSQSMAAGTSQQAASIEETSSSMEEMSSQTRNNSENAVNADALMKETQGVVAQANATMENLTQSMDEISHASNEASGIIKTIDEIAFQTNLLALNAAVEAARAGEAGASFAVVADEVRNLAMRAADAARDTSQILEETLKKVDSGSKLVSSTSQAFEEVSTSSEKVACLITEISQASQDQSKGISLVNKAIADMDHVVQGSAATAEESAAAAEELNAQAEQLKSHMNELVGLINKKVKATSPPLQIHGEATPALDAAPERKVVPGPRSHPSPALAPPAKDDGEEGAFHNF